MNVVQRLSNNNKNIRNALLNFNKTLLNFNKKKRVIGGAKKKRSLNLVKNKPQSKKHINAEKILRNYYKKKYTSKRNMKQKKTLVKRR